ESQDDLIKTYKSGDIFVLPCKRASDGDMDGIPTVIFEAMAYGIPVITTNVSCIPEFVINDYCGFTVDSNDPIALANKIRHVKNIDKNQLFMILKRAQSQVQKNSSVDETIETMIDIWLNKRIDLFMVTHQKNQYKDIKSLKEILDRIFKYTNTEFDLTIVDNDSDVDFKNFIVDYIESKTNVRLIFLKSNLLCGPASNIALESMGNEFALYICSNEGFILKPGFERKALNYMRKQQDVAIAGTLAYAPHYYNGKTYKDNAFFENFRNK
ncbi:MAG: glycosyltransferase, partial [Methanobacteriaceae archaeon]|nr:glycosyltransferase [Methanobacteriaceae archaeon]